MKIDAGGNWLKDARTHRRTHTPTAARREVEAGDGGTGSPLQAQGVASRRQPKSLASRFLHCAHALPGAQGAVPALQNLGALVDIRSRACLHTRRPQWSEDRNLAAGRESGLEVGGGPGCPAPPRPDFIRGEPPGSRPQLARPPEVSGNLEKEPSRRDGGGQHRGAAAGAAAALGADAGAAPDPGPPAPGAHAAAAAGEPAAAPARGVVLGAPAGEGLRRRRPGSGGGPRPREGGGPRRERKRGAREGRPLGILDEADEWCKGEGVMGVLGWGRAPELRRGGKERWARGPWGARPGLRGAETSVPKILEGMRAGDQDPVAGVLEQRGPQNPGKVLEAGD